MFSQTVILQWLQYYTISCWLMHTEKQNTYINCMLQLKTHFSFNQYTKTSNSGKPIIYDNYLQKVKSNNKCLSIYPPIVAEDKKNTFEIFYKHRTKNVFTHMFQLLFFLFIKILFFIYFIYILNMSEIINLSLFKGKSNFWLNNISWQVFVGKPLSTRATGEHL